MLVTAARLHQLLGVTGLLGVGLFCAAAITLGMAWYARQDGLIAAVPTALPADAVVRHAGAQPKLPLPAGSDIPVLLNRIQRTAVEQGLGWPRADYRVNVAAADSPASLEVHCALIGGYPSIRRFVTSLLQGMPALTLREFSLSRASANVGDVEAKLTIVVFLASEEPR